MAQPVGRVREGAGSRRNRLLRVQWLLSSLIITNQHPQVGIMFDEPNRATIPHRHQHGEGVIVEFGHETQELLEQLILAIKTSESSTLRRIERQNNQILAALSKLTADSEMAQAARSAYPILSSVVSDLDFYTPENKGE